jgi:hypothetical protein
MRIALGHVALEPGAAARNNYVHVIEPVGSFQSELVVDELDFASLWKRDSSDPLTGPLKSRYESYRFMNSSHRFEPTIFFFSSVECVSLILPSISVAQEGRLCVGSGEHFRKT